MPIPKPRTGEEQDKFISRCMSNDVMKEDYSDLKQRLAICFTSWRKERGKMDENVVTVPVDSKVAVDVDTRIITISERLGIKALYTFNRKKIIEYYFDKAKEWDEDKAVEWYNEHKTIEVQPEEQAKKFFKMDEEKRIVYGVVYAPWEVDLQGDIMTDIAVEEMEHNFMKEWQDINEMHKISGMGILLESYIAPADFEMNGVKVTKGSWVLVTEASQSVWDKIKKGELVGYSIGYEGEREPIEI